MKFTNPAPRSCGDTAPQLTALFDGEADAQQTREARAHLLSCPACSRQWLDWTRYRDTFQSEPAPIVPPTLLWRVLIATRVTTFARPARRRSRLPQISAAPLRGIEAPLPPRFSAHILAQTTRRPSAHVMLTQSRSTAPLAKSRFQNRSFSFGRAPLWAAPALALWILTLGRADFIATLPIDAPASTTSLAPAVTLPVKASKSTITLAPPAKIVAPAQKIAAPRRAVTLIPVATRPIFTRSDIAAPDLALRISAPISVAVAPAITTATSPARPIRRIENTVAARVPHAIETKTARTNVRPDNGLNRAFTLAISAGQGDIMGARTAPAAQARVRSVTLSARTARAPIARGQTLAASPQTAPRAVRVARSTSRVNSENLVDSRVTLAALTSPISPVRTISSARLRTAVFSDDSMRPRVAHPSATGRRLARLTPDENETRLRVSRPQAQAPTLREIRVASSDNGPKLDELRSAVDDYRASVASDE